MPVRPPLPAPSDRLRKRLRALAAVSALIAGVVCGAAPAASAEPPLPIAPHLPTVSSNSVVEHPGLRIDVTVAFETGPSGLIEAGSPMTLTYHVSNTGDVDLSEVGPVLEDLEVGESTTFTAVGRRITAHELDSGVVTVQERWTVRTPTRSWTAPRFTKWFFTR